MDKILVRIYHQNKDKQNEFVDSFEEGLKLLDKTEADIYTKVQWLNITDLFFRDTKNYIRITSN